MADEVKSRNVVVKSKIVAKDCGEPKKIVNLPETEKQMLLGTIIGTADGIKISKAADGMTEHKGLRGMFEATPADPEKDIVRSGVAFIGEAFQADIVKMLEDENGPESVSFAFEVYVVRATNAAGYSWAYRPLLKAEEADPLAALRSKIASQNAAPLLEAPVGNAKK